MNKYYTYIFFLLIASSIVGQKKSHQQKISDARANFLVKQLNLNESLSKKFTSIHNEFRKEMYAIARAKNKIHKRVVEEQLNESQAKDLILEIEYKEKQLFENKTNFYNKIKTILTYKQSLQLRLAEIQFKRKLLEKLK